MNTYSHAQYSTIYLCDICVIALWIIRAAGNVFNIKLFTAREDIRETDYSGR